MPASGALLRGGGGRAEAGRCRRQHGSPPPRKSAPEAGMSGAERSYRIALRAFPKQYREERGEEIVSTILEGGDGWRPHLREVSGLFWAGVAQRSLQAGGVRTAGSVRAGIRLGAYFQLWLTASGATAVLVNFHRYS